MIFKPLYSLVSLLGSSLAFFIFAFYSFFFVSVRVSTELLFVFLFSSAIIFVLRIFFRGERKNVKSFERKLLKKGVHKSKIRGFLARVEARSFASSHVARLSGLGAVLLFNEFSTSVWLTAFAVALVVGLARFKLRRHNGLDVFTGFVIGALSGYFAGGAYEFFF
jgi:membrane-associated phospholipid phosphatase